jgi:L-lactate permease
MMKTMMKNSKHTREWLYMALTVYAPILIVGAYVAAMSICAQQRNNAQLTKLWEVLSPALPWIAWVALPVLTNIAFGPSLLAFTVCKKKSRFLILIVNVIVIGMTAVVMRDGINRFEPEVWPSWMQWLPFVAIPLLCLWVKWGKAAEATGNSRSGIKMVLAHICAVIAMLALLNYKSPERQVAEHLLNHMTIKWTHDCKTEYFQTYFAGPVADCGWKYEGVPAPRSTEGYSYARQRARRREAAAEAAELGAE